MEGEIVVNYVFGILDSFASEHGLYMTVSSAKEKGRETDSLLPRRHVDHQDVCLPLLLKVASQNHAVEKIQ